MNTSKMNALASLGPVELQVSDLEAQKAFYQDTLGLTLRSSSSGGASLGTPLRELVRLKLLPEARRYRHVAGLYHFCLRVEKRAEFGLLLKHLLEIGAALDGLVDHRMAEAIYLKDAEGNGIELNWDRPRDQWRPWAEWLSMGNAPLDTQGLLEAAEKSGKVFKGIDPETRIGHLHLHVGNLEDGEKFYLDVLGFDRTATVPSQVVFTSAGGYHHHVAFNVWRGLGVSAPPADALGLLEATVLVENDDDLKNLKLRAEAANWPWVSDNGDLILEDPWKHRFRIKKN